MSACERKKSLFPLENITTFMPELLLCRVSMRLARSDWKWKSNRLIVEKVLLMVTFIIPEELVVLSVPYSGHVAP